MRLFAVDCEAEVEKIARAARRAGAEDVKVFCRILCDGAGAEWPLSRKFGCVPEMAVDVLEHAHRLGLEAYGVSFHVGSQQRNTEAWDAALASASAIFRECAERGIHLSMVNLGGGFPTKYLKDVPAVEAYGEAIFRALSKHFGNRLPETIIEPGRGMVGNAGIIEAEVVLVSKKSRDEDEVRWVYLDIGKFGGLAETMDESIRYPIRTEHDGDATVPCVLAGPTCDSADVLYEKEPVSAARLARDRRQGADRGHGRLHDDLFGGRLQRLPAAEVLRDLSSRPASPRELTRGRHQPFDQRWSRTAGSAASRCEGCRFTAARPGRRTAMITIRDEIPARHRRARGAARRLLRRRRASRRPASACAKAALPARGPGARRRARRRRSSAPCACGTSRPARTARRCCSARSRSIRPARASASARS